MNVNPKYLQSPIVKSEIPPINVDAFRILPEEIILKIFSLLKLAELRINCFVSKKWNLLSSNPILWKNVIYKEKAFNNDKWAHFFGKDVVKDECNEEEFSSLPINIVEHYRRFQKLFPDKIAIDCLMLVRLPKTLNGKLSLNKLAELAKKYFPKNKNGYRYFMNDIANVLGNKSIETSYWVLMTIFNFPETENKSFAEKKEIIKKILTNYEIPDTLEATTCILAHYFDTQVRLFKNDPWTFTCCADSVKNSQTLVGGFAPTGLRIEIILNDTSGSAALLKL